MAMGEDVLCEIFLDLYKAYDTLDHGICLDILAAYIVVPHVLHLLRRYWCIHWDCLAMVAMVGVYLGAPFKR